MHVVWTEPVLRLARGGHSSTPGISPAASLLVSRANVAG
jgi:hypothetical protein